MWLSGARLQASAAAGVSSRHGRAVVQTRHDQICPAVMPGLNESLAMRPQHKPEARAEEATQEAAA